MFGLDLGLQIIVAAGSWSIDDLETNVRRILAMGIFLLIAFQGVKAYAKGQKGKAIIEIMLGIVIAIFVVDKTAAEAFLNTVKGLLGFN